jgi:hypothetical protein
MSDEVRELVDRRWNEYGIEAESAAEDGRRSLLRQLLRR